MENKNMKNKLEAYKKELELASSNLSHSDFIKVYQQNKTKSKDLNEIVNRLKDSNAKILGCVLNEDLKIK